ncbi:MAG: ABC transporter substrate-binding protein [Desulfobacterales bacterium]|nr:ABC transporter substrate-binding protein [Desulfobacterales bacterium]
MKNLLSSYVFQNLYGKILIYLAAGILLSFPAPGLAGRAEVPETLDPIRIAVNNWTSQIILSRIAGRVFEKLGYRVVYSRQKDDEQWGAMHRGAVHVQVEVWEGTNSKLFRRMMDAGGVVDAGTYDVRTREDWWYPDYVEALCPGLPDWNALKRCYSLFATDKTRPYGQYLTGPWERPDRARIKALGMKFKRVEVADGAELTKKIIAAIEKRRPIVFFNWSPNWVEAKVPGKFVEFPSYDPECETDERWGVNKRLLYDCGNPRDAWLKKAAWSGMPEKWPCAFKILQNINFDRKTIAELAYEVDVNREKTDAVAARWLKNNRKLWQSWIPRSCGKAKKIRD